MVLPQSKPSRTGKILALFDRTLAHESGLGGLEGISPSGSENLDPNAAIASLKELVAAGDDRLDPILGSLTDAARQLTGASGAALAMWKDGAMVCRACNGKAPPLGAQLSADTGISGECLRTAKVQVCSDTENDPMVDAEVCRSLGLRSIVALPIQGWRGVNGILEVFSADPDAFSEQHIAVLHQLAALAERARALRPHGASSAPPKLLSEHVGPISSGLLPASDRLGDVVLAFVGNRSTSRILAGIGLAAAAVLIGVVIWLGWHGPEQAGSKAHAGSEVSTKNAEPKGVIAPALTGNGGASLASANAPDVDPIWKANPGGEILFSSNGKPSAGAPVKLASEMDFVMVERRPIDRAAAKNAPLLADVAGSVSAKPAVARKMVDKLPGMKRKPDTDPSPVSDVPSIATPTSESPLDEVLSAKASLPELGFSVSQGVSGGQLVHRVPPVYPVQARVLRAEGTVVLAAVVMEDGSVRDVKVVEGSPMFTRSAIDAVKRWRYRPYQLDGKPVKNAVRISVDFKFPSR